MYTGLLRLRYLLLTVIGVVTVVAVNSVPSLDWDLLAFAGQHGLRAFVDYPAVQIGPAAVPMFGLLAALPNPTTFAAILAVVCALFAVRMIELTGIRCGVEETRAAWLALAGGVPVVIAAAYTAGVWGHLEDVVAVTMVVATAYAVARLAPAWAIGGLLGLAIAFKPWAVVAVGLLLAVQRDRRVAWVTLIVVAAVGWVPFLIAHPGTLHAVTSYRASIRANSPMHLFGFAPGLHAPGWWRTAEMIGGAAAGLAAAWRGRVYAAPLVGIAVRIGTDSAAFSYYGFAPVVFALLFDVTRPRRVPVWTFGTVLALYAPGEFSLGDGASEAVRLAWALAVLSAVALPRSGARPAERVDSLSGAEEQYSDKRGRHVETVQDGALRGAIHVAGDR